MDFSANWILNNNQDEVEKFLMEIEDYLKSMGSVENVNEKMIQLQYQEDGQQKAVNLTLAGNLGSLENPEKMKTIDDPEKQEVEKKCRRLRKFTMFDVKMILIGSAALMFSKITGLYNF